MRELHEADAWCPQCGHNRDRSAVSSIDQENGMHRCQQCGATWRESQGHEALAPPVELQDITEEMGIHKDWYKERPKTPDELAAFAKRLLTEYHHDYGTICHAAAALALAGCRLINSDQDQGGVTGFQASAIFWEFARGWMPGQFEGPSAKILFMREMLYPQNEKTFRTISLETFGWIQDQAKRLLQSDGTSAQRDVVAHWQSIVDGAVPFGYRIGD